MMEPLIQPTRVSEEILTKIVSDITSKYELRQNISIPRFVEDSNTAIQELMLYSGTIEQLFTHNSILPVHVLRAYHSQIYRLAYFFIKIIQKMHNKTRHQLNSFGSPLSLCSNCQHFVHERNIKSMQREILDYHKYSIQRLDDQFRCQFKQNERQSEDEDKGIISQSYFRKKMSGIQKSMDERQNNLLQCIDDFQMLRTNLLVQVKKRESQGDVKTFNIREYIIEISEHLINNLRKIEEKIFRVRKSNISPYDQATQISQEPETVSNTQLNQLHKQNFKLEAEIKKLIDSKFKLEDFCKNYQTQNRDLSARIDALESQNKKIRDEIFSEKLKGSHRQKLLKSAEKSQQKVWKQKQDEEKIKKQTAIANFQNLLSQSGDFANQFSTSIKENLSNKDFANRYDQVAPMIKEVFKKTLDRYTNQKAFMHIMTQKKKTIKDQTVETQPTEKGRSRDTNLRVPLDKKRSRQSSQLYFQKKNQNLSISNVINFKYHHNHKSLKSQVQISNNSIQRQLKELNSDNQKRKRLTKLSIFSDIKNINQQLQPIDRGHLQKRRQSTQFYPQQVLSNFLSTDTSNGKLFKKSTFRRNRSQQDLKQPIQIKQSFKIGSVKSKTIDSIAARLFFFTKNSRNCNDLNQDNVQEPNMTIGQRSKLILEVASTDQHKIQRNKIILTLEELNYLTALFSLLARIHLMSPSQYRLLKQWILSFRQTKKIKDDENNQTLLIRKLLSQIIFKHRQCHSTSSLCPHLYDFLQSIESFLVQAELQSLEKAEK